MKTLLAFILLSTSVAHAQIIPIDNSKLLVQDELFPYQWGLFNQGQTLIREKDDIHNLPMKGIIGKDIGWDSLVGTFAQRRPIVAVLDSGVDLSHPELQGNLWTNEAECGKDPKVDNDNNKLAGDCHGWNFTEDMTSDAAKDPGDIDGHGTHIAGIIAALNNGSGMVGVTPNALIMPIKVMKDSNSKSEVQSSDAFARGIIYAVDNGADVINMSLGWPRSLETKILRDAVYYALGNGVPIVAAAGNNNSAEPLFPCAYDGVICVAASTINGKFAGFSNYGGHVDTIAPGEGILGLNPMLFEPDFFAVPGFELRSGTSQAAPLVTGMIAALKAKNKDITIDQLFAKLYQAQQNIDREKYILGGEATWNAINADVTTPVIRPIFKKVRQIVFRGDSLESKLAISIRNFGTPSDEIFVKVESLSGSIAFNSDSQKISKLIQGEVKDLVFDVSIKDINAESSVIIKVTIEHGEQNLSFTNEIPVVRDLRNDSKLKKSSFAFLDKPLPVGGTRNGEIVPLISTVETHGTSTKHEFFMKKTWKEEKRIELTLFTRRGEKYVQLPEQIKIENALSMVNFIRTDLNSDGKEDYLVHTLNEKDQKKYFSFAFYNSDLKPLWPKFQQVKLTLDLFLESLNDITFVNYSHPSLGKMKVPAFFTNGMLPKIDQVITSWDKYDQSRINRLYYLEPNDAEFRVRAFTTNVWRDSLKAELKTKWFETVEIEQLLPASKKDVESGSLRALVSVGLGTKRQLLIHTFDTQSTSHGVKLPQLVLQADSVDPMLSLTSEGLVNNGEVFFNIYDRTRSKLVTTREQSQVNEYIFTHETETDLIAGHIASFEQGPKRFTIFQSREELISVTTGQVEKRSTRPKLRYSFFSQKLLSEMYFPVIYKRAGSINPALYVDSTTVTGNRVYLFEEQNGELIASIRNSVLVPANCKSLNPTFSPSSGSHEFIFLCLEDKDFVIRSLEMN
jgi:cell wall-associated protease